MREPAYRVSAVRRPAHRVHTVRRPAHRVSSVRGPAYRVPAVRGPAHRVSSVGGLADHGVPTVREPAHRVCTRCKGTCVCTVDLQYLHTYNTGSIIKLVASFYQEKLKLRGQVSWSRPVSLQETRWGMGLRGAEHPKGGRVGGKEKRTNLPGIVAPTWEDNAGDFKVHLKERAWPKNDLLYFSILRSVNPNHSKANLLSATPHNSFEIQLLAKENQKQ